MSDMSTIHATLTAGGDWEINVKHSWRRNPPKNLLLEQQPFAQNTAGDCETNVKQLFWGPLRKNLLGGESHLLQRAPQKTNVSFCPKTFTMAEDPKANAAREKCKIELRNWQTSLKKWWGHLPQNLLAAQDGSAPENHRESESNSAPKPLLWLKTPKLLLLGQKISLRPFDYIHPCRCFQSWIWETSQGADHINSDQFCNENQYLKTMCSFSWCDPSTSFKANAEQSHHVFLVGNA